MHFVSPLFYFTVVTFSVFLFYKSDLAINIKHSECAEFHDLNSQVRSDLIITQTKDIPNSTP